MKGVEEKIDNFIKKNYTEKEIGQKYSTLTIQRKMSLINMKDNKIWKKFKIGLREEGWVI